MFLPIKRHKANDFTISAVGVVGFFLPQKKEKKRSKAIWYPIGALLNMKKHLMA